MGGDDTGGTVSVNPSISIHASRMGGDILGGLLQQSGINFNPRLPDGRRPAPQASTCQEPYFNPRLPDGRRPSHGLSTPHSIVFQSTPPGWEATCLLATVFAGLTGFQSTPPGWEATSPALYRSPNPIISIHASRMGGDYILTSYRLTQNYFNPRLPDGRRP